MTTLEEVRARFARRWTAVRRLVERTQHPATLLMSMASSIETECSLRSPPSGASSPRCSATTTVAATPCRGSSPTGRPAAWKSCSPNTASYCNARGRIVTGVLRTLARRTAQELQAAVAEQWKWNGRNVFIADGSHVSMPDTPENQASYPQPPTQKPGIGFPLARIAVLLSLATGACHDLAIAPYKGKGTGETTLLREMYDSLKPGDVVLADALFDNYFLVCELRDRGIDLVARVKYQRAGSQTAAVRARWRHPRVAAAQQAARDDGGAIPPLPKEPGHASGDR